MLNLIWDMETNDPDDFLTLLFLLGHPGVNLQAVTLQPGTTEQVGLVQRAIREWFGKNIPVGASALDSQKKAVSGWHRKAYGPIVESREAEPAEQVLARYCNSNTVMLTGGPPKNLSAMLRNQKQAGKTVELKKLVMQGGFAGVGVVPEELQMEKFKGLTTCPSFNLNGDPKGTLEILAHGGFGKRMLVSKNVCHRVVYDQILHEQVGQFKNQNQGLAYIWRGMENYLRENPQGKIIHDLLAAVCMLDETVATWAEIELYREKGGWGARPAPGSNTWITIDYDRQKFLQLFLATS